METPDVMEGLRLACRNPELAGIDPENITYYFRRVMVIPTDKAAGVAVLRKSLLATMHLNANLPAAYFGVPTAEVVEVGLEEDGNLFRGDTRHSRRLDRGRPFRNTLQLRPYHGTALIDATCQTGSGLAHH